MSETTKNAIQNGIKNKDSRYELTANKNGRSQVWQNFQNIQFDGQLLDFVCCKKRKIVFAFNAKQGTGTLNRHKCTEVVPRNQPTLTSFSRKRVPKSVMETLARKQLAFVAKDLQPFSITEGSGFREYIQAVMKIGADYGEQSIDDLIVSRKKLTGTILNDEYNKVKNQLIIDLADKHLALTTDMWTDQYTQRSFICLSGHYISEPFDLRVSVLGVREFLEDKKTGENICIHVNDILAEYGLIEKLRNSVIVTDNGANVVAAFKSYKRLSCACHNLNLVMENVMEKHPVEELKCLIENSKKLVKYFKHSELNHKLSKSLKQDVVTRWNSVYIMLNSIFEVQNEIQNLLLLKNELKRISDIDFSLIENVIAFLKPFKDCSEKLSSDKEPTIHIFALWFEKLKKHCQAEVFDSLVMEQIKAKTLHSLEKRFQPTTLHLVGLFFNEKKHHVVETVKAMMGEINEINKEIVVDFGSKKQSPVSQKHEFEEFLDKNQAKKIKLYKKEIDREIETYYATIARPEMNVLEFWKEANDLKLLQVVAKQVLSVPDFVPHLNGIGLCVVNLMDDMHEYMRGLFLLMYCGPTVLLAYLYIRTSQELRPPDGSFAIMMFEHRADLRNRQRNSSTTSSVDRRHSGGASNNNHGSNATATTGLTTITTHTSGGHSTTGALSAGSTTMAPGSRSYDLYSAELDVYREKRKQRNFGSMAATQIICLCPLMVLRFARLSMEETYENQKHFDFTYLMFVWVAFLPTVIFPCIFGSQIIPRTEQERLRGYFRLSSKRLHKHRSVSRDGVCNRNSQSSREDSIEKDENTNTTQATSIIANSEGFSLNNDEAVKSNKYATHSNSSTVPPPYARRTGKDRKYIATAKEIATQNGNLKGLDKNVRIKKNDVKINIIAEGQKKQLKSGEINIKSQTRHSFKNCNLNGMRHGSASSTISPITNTQQRKLTIESVDNNSFSNITASTYCNGNNNSLLDDAASGNFGDGEDSSIVSGMIVQGSNSHGVGVGYYAEKKWSLSGPSSLSLRQKDLSFSDTASFASRLDSSSTLARDLEIIDLLERERSMENVRCAGERRRLPDIEKIMQRSPKFQMDPYSYDISTTATMASSISTKDTTQTTLSTPVPPGADPLQCNSNEAYSTTATTLNDADVLPTQPQYQDEEVPQDFFDNYTPGGNTNTPAIAAAPYQYQYTRRLSRKSSHPSQSSTSHRNASKRDSFNSLNSSDLIAGAFGELDPTQPLNKMSVIENRMRRSGGGRTSSFSTSSARSSMKSRDYSHGSSTHSGHPELDFRENIFAEL